MQDESLAGGRDPGGVLMIRVRSHGAGDSGGVRGVVPRRQVGRRPVLELGDDLLDDRVAAVGLVCLDQAQGAVGDERVVAVPG